MNAADIIILLIVVVAMVFAEAVVEVPRSRRENSWTALFLEPGRSASKVCTASTAWIL